MPFCKHVSVSSCLCHKRHSTFKTGALPNRYKPESDYSIWKATASDRRSGNFTATHCEYRRRIKFNWTDFLKLAANEDPAVGRGANGFGASVLAEDTTTARLLGRDVLAGPPAGSVGELPDGPGSAAIGRLLTDRVFSPLEGGVPETASSTLSAPFDYVVAMLDDIFVTRFRWKEFLATMIHNSLDVATPYLYRAPGTSFMRRHFLEAMTEVVVGDAGSVSTSSPDRDSAGASGVEVPQQSIETLEVSTRGLHR